MTAEAAPGQLGSRPLAAIGTEVVFYLLGILAALVAIGVLIAALHADPLVAYQSIVSASLGSVGGLGQTLNKMSPLLFGSLAVTIAMRGGLLNIGVDGQMYLGAVFATGTAFLLGNRLPQPLAVPLVLAAGVLGGAVAVLPAAILRGVWQVSEIFVTVMLNFVIFFLVVYLATGPWNDPTAGEAITRPTAVSTHLPIPFADAGAHVGFLIAIALALGANWFLRRTIVGYEIRAAGDNPRAAALSGLNVRFLAFLTLLIAGAVVGLGGAVEVSGYYWRLLSGLSPNYGYMSILIAVIGRRSPIGVIFASAAFAMLLVGSDSLQRSAGVPASLVLLLQASVVLGIIAADMLRRSRWLARGRFGALVAER